MNHFMVLEHKFHFQKFKFLIYVLITTYYLRPEVQADKGNYSRCWPQKEMPQTNKN